MDCEFQADIDAVQAIDAVPKILNTSSGIVQALLDITGDGLITRCRCGPI